MLIIEEYAHLVAKIEQIKAAISETGQNINRLTDPSNEDSRSVVEIQEELRSLRELLKNYEEFESKLKVLIYSLEGLRFKIAILKILEGKNYREIAEELGYNYGYIRKVASEKHEPYEN